MEEAEEKMAALKRAYADILLNMAKESAARIMASDRRALRFQQDLFRSKEEALSTLLRVKGIMDSKVNEAERLSLSQVRRIQELEIQVTEADKTIKYLKIELKRVNDELRSMKSNQTEPFDKQSSTEGHFTFHGCMCQKALSQKTANGPCYLSFENSSRVEPLEDFAKNSFVNDPVLTSIIMRSKEPELYRNGCTQRIRALEQSIITRKVAHGQTDGQLPKNKCFNCESKVTEEPTISEFPEADNVLTRTETNGSKHTGQQGGRCEKGQVFQGFSLQRKRSRIKRMMSSVHNPSNQVETAHELSQCPYFSELGANRMTEHGETISQTKGEAPKEMDANLDPDSSGWSEDLEGGRSHLGTCINENKPSLLKCQTSVYAESDINGLHLKSDNKKYQSASTNVDHINCCKPDMISDVLSEGSIRNDGDSMLAPEDGSRINQRKSENLETSIAKVEPENIDAHWMNPKAMNRESVESSGAPIHCTGNRLLKYTFRRKRKRGLSTSVDENVLPEKNNTSDGRPVGKQTVLTESQEPALLSGSSRDSRRIAQVARQLISLSEKRW